MIVGVPVETAEGESRVSLIPSSVKTLTESGHKVIIQRSAGIRSGITDDEYRAAGALIARKHEKVFTDAQVIAKVSRPTSAELSLLKPEHIVFAFFYFECHQDLTRQALELGSTFIAYETIMDDHGMCPVVASMEEITARIAVQQGAQYVETAHIGRGILLGGAVGVDPAEVVVLGDGPMAAFAAVEAAARRARVTVVGFDVSRLRRLAAVLPPNATTILATSASLSQKVAQADLVIGAATVTRGAPPILVDTDMLKRMRPGAVIVDAAIDQGGCLETSRPTTLTDPLYLVYDVVHCCTTNLPGTVPRTSTYSLAYVTLPYILSVANKGWMAAAQDDTSLARGVNLAEGAIFYEPIARAFQADYRPLSSVLSSEGMSRLQGNVKLERVPQLFLSYAREDERPVLDLYRRLTAAGLRPWMDKMDILPGERWPGSIRRAIQRADFVLVCLSENSVEKRGVLQKEISEALDLCQEKLETDIYLIPVRLDKCEMPPRLCDFQWVDLAEEGGWEQLLRSLRQTR